MKEKLLAIDIGGTFIKYGVYDSDEDQLILVDKVKGQMTTQKEMIDVICQLINQYEVTKVGISMPGTIDSTKDYVQQGGSYQFNNQCYFAKLIEESVGNDIEVHLINDAKSAAMCEMKRGNLVGVKNGLMLVIGTGLGSSIIIDGKIYSGTHLYAGELSIILDDSIFLHKGNALVGTKVSVPGLVQRAKELDSSIENGIILMEHVKNNDDDVKKLYNHYLEDLARFIFNFQISFDPEQIVIGGGISANHAFINDLNEHFEKIFKVLPVSISHNKLIAASCGNDANLYGAMYHFLEHKK